MLFSRPLRDSVMNSATKIIYFSCLAFQFKYLYGIYGIRLNLNY